MRVRRRFPTGDGERGATAVIVVLTLVALFGMIVLTVDVGQLLFVRRSMVNGSDAAALAAAQTCITDHSLGGANISADQLATANVGGPVTGEIVDQSNCEVADADRGYVTVRYEVPQDLFFAGVLGFEGPTMVRTGATAAWAPANSAGTIMPIILYSSDLQGNCDLDIDNLTELPELPPGGPECYFWFDKDVLEGASWGFLNLNTWPEAGDSSPYPNCNQSGGADDLGEWIGGSLEDGPYPSNYPDPTYVCSASGHVSSNWSSGDVGSNLEGRIDDVVVFPVNDPDTDIEGNNGVIQYNIIGFAPLELVDVLEGTEAGGIAPVTCSFNWGRPNPGMQLVLQNVNGGSCPGGGPVTGFADVEVNDVVPDTANFTYDATNHVLTWTGPRPAQNQTVEFTWWQAGECGTPPPGQSLSNAVCIKTMWQGIQLGGTWGESGLDLGLRGIRLCDHEYESCPDQ